MRLIEALTGPGNDQTGTRCSDSTRVMVQRQKSNR